jgi:hypothetical protein
MREEPTKPSATWWLWAAWRRRYERRSADRARRDALISDQLAEIHAMIDCAEADRRAGRLRSDEDVIAGLRR